MSTGAVGGTVEVALTCDANPGISGAALNIGFDPDTLQYLDCTMAEGFDPGLFSAVETEGQLRVTFTDPYADFYETGKLLSIRFRIIGEADGDVLSTLTLSAPTGAVADVRYRSVECSVTNGGVYIGGSAIHLLPGSSYILDRESGYITGVAPQTPPAAFLQNFTGNPKVEPSGGRYIATGNAIAAGSERYTVIVTGDLNGDGQSHRSRLSAYQALYRTPYGAGGRTNTRRRHHGRRAALAKRLPDAQAHRFGTGLTFICDRRDDALWSSRGRSAP